MIADSIFLEEITGQPAALRWLAQAYAGQEGRARLATAPPPSLILGMGASYHAGLLGAQHLRQCGQATLALEATEALYGAAPAIGPGNSVVYISQSGASGEILPALDRLPPGAHVTALTNDEDSLLARRAQLVLPLLAGDEQTVASKTFANSVGLLWLLSQSWTSRLATRDIAHLENVAGHLTRQLERIGDIRQVWLEQLAQASTYVIIGAGAQAITARHAAMVVMEWLKVPAVHASVGAFRHGPIEIVQPGLGVVVLAAPGPAHASSCQLAQELADYGASVVIVEQGRSRRLDEPAGERLEVDDALAPILDMLPIQIFAEALARERGLAPGFRHIEKVVTLI